MNVSSTFPPDEFDDLVTSAPVGVHRRPRSRWRPVIPFLVIIIVAPLLAWGLVWAIQTWTGSDSGDDSTVTQQSAGTYQAQDDSSTDGASVEEEADSSADDTAAEATTTEPEETIEEEPEVVYSTTVQVLNNTGITGYAGQQAGVLESAGFSDVSSGNATGWTTTVNTVYYASEDLEATAQEVADNLGIDRVQLETASVTSGIVVVLCS